MVPQHWPKGFVYATESVSPEMNLSLLRMFLGAAEDFEKISWVIENKTVYPHMQILPLSKSRFKNSSHPLIDKRARRGYVQRGVFATQMIPKGTELGEYVGEMYLVDREQYAESIFAKTKLSEFAFRLTIGTHYWITEPKNMANELAMINDYRGIAPEPNVRSELIAHRGLRYLAYVTIKDIPVHGELLTSYGETYWDIHRTKAKNYSK
jgi:SET domain-containing protein